MQQQFKLFQTNSNNFYQQPQQMQTYAVECVYICERRDEAIMIYPTRK